MSKIKYITAKEYWIRINKDELAYLPANIGVNGDNVVIDLCVANSALHDYIFSKNGKDILVSNGKVQYTRNITLNEANCIYRKLSNAPIPMIRYLGLCIGSWFCWNNPSPLIFIDIHKTDLSMFELKTCTNRKIYCYVRGHDLNLVKEKFTYYRL